VPLLQTSLSELQSLSLQHCWQTPVHMTCPAGHTHAPASVSSNEVLHAKLHAPLLVHKAVPFWGAGHGVLLQPSVHPASGTFAWFCSQFVPHA
jgi:hypothetical protein